jgi:hypothetical protein
MQLQLSVQGGFLPHRQPPISIDINHLSSERAAELIELLHASDFFEQPESLSAPAGAADYREYVITADDGARQHTVRVPEVAAPPELLKLIDCIEGCR